MAKHENSGRGPRRPDSRRPGGGGSSEGRDSGSGRDEQRSPGGGENRGGPGHRHGPRRRRGQGPYGPRDDQRGRGAGERKGRDERRRGERGRDRGGKRPPRDAEERPKKAMTDAELAKAEALVREVVDLEGYEVLLLTITRDRRIVLTLDNPRRPVNLGGCTFMNHRLRRALEAAEMDADDYAIEVASPGTRRPLFTAEHFERFLDEGTVLRIPQEDGGREVVRGWTRSVDGETLHFETVEGQEREIPISELDSAFLDPSVDEEPGEQQP